MLSPSRQRPEGSGMWDPSVQALRTPASWSVTSGPVLVSWHRHTEGKTTRFLWVPGPGMSLEPPRGWGCRITEMHSTQAWGQGLRGKVSKKLEDQVKEKALFSLHPIRPFSILYNQSKGVAFFMK